MTTAVLLPCRPESPPPVPPVPPTVPPHHGRAALSRLVRYAGVSVVATTSSLTVLFVLVGMVGMPAAWSNVVATAVGTVPSFELNRRWVWRRQGRRSLLGQIVPFTALSFTGLLVSTVAVTLVSTRTMGWSHWGHTLAVESANVAAYGSLWVVQYVVLDRILFRAAEVRTAPEPAPARTVGRQAASIQVGPTDPILVSLTPSTVVQDGNTRSTRSAPMQGASSW